MNPIQKPTCRKERSTGAGQRRLRCAIAGSTLLALVPSAASALSTEGPLVDFLVDAGQGQFNSAEASDFLALLNEFQLDGYSLRFSDGSALPLSLPSGALNVALLGKEQGYAELRALTGPAGSFVFAAGADDDALCSATGAVSGSSLSDIATCLGAASGSPLGAELSPGSSLRAAAAAASQVNTIDLLILRPTTQYMITLRRFVAPMGGYRSRDKDDEPSGGGAGDPEALSGPWGVYFQGGGSFGSLDSSNRNTGFNIDNQLATAGVDYRFSDALVAGFLFNFTGSQSRFAGVTGRVNADIYRFMPFVSITPFENAYIDIMSGYSYHSYDSNRSGSGTVAAASYSADQAMASINLGYSYPFGALELTGIAGGSYVGTDVNGYTERGQGTLVSVGDYHVSSWTSNLGLQLAYSYSAPFGVVQPQLRMEWVHEFDNQPHKFNVTVPALGNLALPLVAGNRVTDWGNISAGVQTLFAHGVVGFVNYQAQVFSEGQNHLVEGGVRLEF